MKQAVTIKDLERLADEARARVWDNAAAHGREPKIYMHWSAGHYDQCHDSYHVCITGGGEVYLMAPLYETTDGTWKRNSGAINVAINGCWDAGSSDLGSEPPTEVQLEALAQVVAAIANGLWLTIDKAHVMTHGEAANNEDGYYDAHQPYAWWNDSYGDGDTRGDLEYLGTPKSPCYNPHATDGSRGGDVLRGNANFYRDMWKIAEEVQEG